MIVCENHYERKCVYSSYVISASMASKFDFLEEGNMCNQSTNVSSNQCVQIS